MLASHKRMRFWQPGLPSFCPNPRINPQKNWGLQETHGLEHSLRFNDHQSSIIFCVF
jgi:hypothetical protein